MPVFLRSFPLIFFFPLPIHHNIYDNRYLGHSEIVCETKRFGEQETFLYYERGEIVSEIPFALSQPPPT